MYGYKPLTVAGRLCVTWFRREKPTGTRSRRHRTTVRFLFLDRVINVERVKMSLPRSLFVSVGVLRQVYDGSDKLRVSR